MYIKCFSKSIERIPYENLQILISIWLLKFETVYRLCPRLKIKSIHSNIYIKINYYL